jgi:DNA-binding response OmpR family regulator
MEIFLLTTAAQPTTEVLPALGLLGHQIQVCEFDVSPLLSTTADAVLIDGRFNLAGARAFTKVLATAEVGMPVVVVLKEGGLVALSADWAVDDVLLDTAGPAEVDARLRLALARRSSVLESEPGVVKVGDLTIEESTYTAKLKSWLSTRGGCSPARTCCRRCGAMTTSAAPAPWTCTCGGFAPSWEPSTRP